MKLSAYTPSIHNLDSIFGIKAITMVLILMGHASAFIIGGPSMNSDFKEEVNKQFFHLFLLNLKAPQSKSRDYQIIAFNISREYLRQ